jgi:hypothetical protein
MSDAFVFYPHQRLGLAFHFVAILLFGVVTAAGVWFASQAVMGPAFLLYLLPVLLGVSAIPLLIYRVYSLRNASYTLEQDGIRLRWGWRAVDIPMNAVLWVHPAAELTYPLTYPRLCWPGAVRGKGHLPRAAEVEFMAAGTRDLILIATRERTFAISPANPQAFMETFQRLIEIGSFFPLEARSIYPSVLLRRVWGSTQARWLLISGAGFSLLLLAWVSLAIPSRSQIPLGFLPDAAPGEPGPAVRLLLLPVISGLFFFSDALLGLFFFRREDRQPLALLVWGAGSLTPLLFLVAVFFLLGAASG